MSVKVYVVAPLGPPARLNEVPARLPSSLLCLLILLFLNQLSDNFLLLLGAQLPAVGSTPTAFLWATSAFAALERHQLTKESLWLAIVKGLSLRHEGVKTGSVYSSHLSLR